MDNLVYQKNKKLSTDFVEHFEKIKKLLTDDFFIMNTIINKFKNVAIIEKSYFFLDVITIFLYNIFSACLCAGIGM